MVVHPIVHLTVGGFHLAFTGLQVRVDVKVQAFAKLGQLTFQKAGIVFGHKHFRLLFCAVRQLLQRAAHVLMDVFGTVRQLITQHLLARHHHQTCQHFRQLLITLNQALAGDLLQRLEAVQQLLYLLAGCFQGFGLAFVKADGVAGFFTFLLTGFEALGIAVVVTGFFAILAAFHQPLFKAFVVGFAANILQFFGGRQLDFFFNFRFGFRLWLTAAVGNHQRGIRLLPLCLVHHFLGPEWQLPRPRLLAFLIEHQLTFLILLV